MGLRHCSISKCPILVAEARVLLAWLNWRAGEFFWRGEDACVDDPPDAMKVYEDDKSNQWRCGMMKMTSADSACDERYNHDR